MSKIKDYKKNEETIETKVEKVVPRGDGSAATKMGADCMVTWLQYTEVLEKMQEYMKAKLKQQQNLNKGRYQDFHAQKHLRNSSLEVFLTSRWGFQNNTLLLKSNAPSQKETNIECLLLLSSVPNPLTYILQEEGQ